MVNPTAFSVASFLELQFHHNLQNLSIPVPVYKHFDNLHNFSTIRNTGICLEKQSCVYDEFEANFIY